ncbi:MAG: hypothetical protein U0931_40100 [Vulcanimicrobiota bacterium]
MQGEWEGHYGSQGYYLCGPTGSSDISGLPGYISALVPGTGSVAPRRLDYASSATGKAYAYDARCLTYSQDGTRHKARGCWKSSLDGSGVLTALPVQLADGQPHQLQPFTVYLRHRPGFALFAAFPLLGTKRLRRELLVTGFGGHPVVPDQ